MSDHSMAAPGGTVTEPTPIDGATALRLLREVVAERPDYVYEPPEGGSGGACVYVWEGRPSCVVGCVLARAGYSIDTIAGLEGALIDTARHNVEEIRIDDAAADILRDAQRIQDIGEPWSVALVDAERTAVRLGVTA